MSNSFRWSALDHQTIERTLTSLKRQITKEILSGDHLTPIGESKNIGTFRPHRLFHSFEVIQEERANEWVERAYKVYLDQWAAQEGEKTPDFIFAIWMNALYHYLSDEVLPLLRLAFGVDDRAMKLLDRTFASLPQGIEASRRAQSVNRIYSGLIERWGNRTIPHEANIAELAINRRMSKSLGLNVPPVEIPPRPAVSQESRSKYKRAKEKDLRERLSQDPDNRSLLQQLSEELTKQYRLAQELLDIQGTELAISVFGRTDLEIAEEIKALRVRLIIFSEDDVEPGEKALEEPPPIFTHSESYESISFKGESYTLQERQAAVVRMLHEAVKKGHPPVSFRKIQSIPGCEDIATLRDIFKSRLQLWGTLIVNCEETGEGRGFYRLHPSISS